MASVLFVEPSELRCEKLGPMMLSAVLKARGHAVDWSYGGTFGDFDGDYDFVCVSLMVGDAVNWDGLRERYPGARFIAGGPAVTFGPGQTPEWVAEVYGPAENAIAGIIDTGAATCEGCSRKSIDCSYPMLSDSAWPDRELYGQFTGHRMKRFITCRGCDWSCAYCFNSAAKNMWSREKRMSRRTQEDVVAEALHVKEKYGLELAYFNDDDFARDEKWLLNFSEQWQFEMGCLPFVCSVRAESVTTKTASLLGLAGCTWVNMALESANTYTLKLLNRPANQDKVFNAVRTIQQYCGMRVRLQNMIGLPVADPLGDALDTLEYNQRCRPADSWCAIYQPLPGTELHRYCVEKGFISEALVPSTFTGESRLYFEAQDRGGPRRVNVLLERLHRWWHLAARGNWSRDLVNRVLEVHLTREDLEAMQELRWREGAKMLYGEEST